MTSSACHLGEPTLKSSVTAKTSLIAAKVLPSEAWHHLEELAINRSVVAHHDETSTEQISSLAGYQQTRSGSSDSGRLSLISSFGSLSFGGYHLGSNHPYSTNPSSSDSASRQSMSIVDLDQHQFYCSLMLLNSLDFCQLEHQKPISIQQKLAQRRNQDQASLPSIETSSSRLSQTELTSSDLDSTASPPKLQEENPQENRPRWFIGKISSGRKFRRDKGVAANKVGKLSKITVEKSTKKRGSGLSILGSGWQGQGAGKYVAAVAAATNSASFVDKLLTHMIKRNGQSAPSSMSSVSQNNNGKYFKEQAMTMSNNKSSGGTNRIGDSGGFSGSCAKNNPTVSEQPKKQKASHSSGGIHLLSDLSRRLARRCGVKTKADQTGGGSSSDDCLSARKTSESGSGLSSEREVSSESKSCSVLEGQQAATSCCGAVATSEESSACAGKPEFQYVRRDDSKPNGSNACIAHRSMNLGSSEASQQSTKVSAATDSCLKQPACEHHQNENQLQVQQTAPNNNTLAQHNNNNLISSNNQVLNASSSTLNTTPSHHCFCDNETCPSSGFVSSSTTGGSGGGAIVGGSGSSGYGCIGSISGGNCGDSTTTTHSCNSSTYNESISIVTPPLPSCSNCGVAGASSRGANNDSDIASVTNSLGRQFIRDSQHLHSTPGCEGQSTNQNQQQILQNQSQQDHQFGATMAAASPIHLEANAEPQLNDLANTNTNLSSPRDHKDRQVSHQPTTEIQIFTVEDQPQQDANKSDQVQQQDMKQQKEEQHGNNKDGHLKPKTSLLTRARNSTINLASLATVTNRFSSASVGNLWHGTGGHHNSHSDYTAGELATDDSGEGGIKPLDYVARGAFDCYHPDDNHNLSSPTTEPKSINSSSSGSKLLSVASCGSTRKLSTKEKCRRQKEAERVEKLKQLVSYLKSGSSQPVVSPVALEADEIELAERYKLHVILRDDLLGDLSTADGDQQQKQLTQNDQSLSSDGVNKPLIDNKTINAEHKTTTHKPVEQNDIAKKSSLINHSIGGTTTSSPASSSSSSSMIQAHHSANGGRSIPHIGNVTWVLRHSISDPGNNFEHSPAFSIASSSPSTRDHQHHHHHHHDHPTTHENHPQHQQHEEHQHHQQHQDTHDHCSSCAPSSSYSGSSLSNYCLATGSSTLNRGSVVMPMHQPTSNQNQLPKLFYIDDMDMIPTFSSNSLVTAASSSVTAAPSASGAPIQTSTPIASASSTSCCSPMLTPAIVTGDVSLGSTSVTNKNSSSTSSASAWTQPQNLATWIDNEVNSLVSDLEAKSQQLQVKNESKHSKSGKKKWLLVTGSHSSRRSSSGAHST